MSTREIEEKFTRSEVYFVAWRSSETCYQMQEKMKPPPGSGGEAQSPDSDSVNVPENLPNNFFDPKTGELDLRRVTGNEAYRYCQSIGMILPVMPGTGGRNASKKTEGK